MKLKKTTTISIILLVLASTGLFFVPFSLTENSADFLNYEPIDLGSKIRNTNYPISGDAEIATSGASSSSTELTVIESRTWMILDDYTGYYSFDVYNLVAMGTTAEIWIQNNTAWLEGDPRPNPVVTQDQIDYLLAEFEDVILPQDIAYFGTPDSHNGSEALLEAWGYVPPGYYYEPSARNVILLSNVRDDNYYDPTYPNYIAGFYSPSFEAYFDRNVISIDVYDWENRVGGDGSRPYLYEGIIAHEYQHLIHDDYNSGDDSFMNEACSMYAEPLCGYGYSWGQMEEFLTKSDNSLTLWGDQGGRNILADYGGAQLWAVYLIDQFGDEFLAQFVQSGKPGIEGINAALDYFGIVKDFDEVYHDWRIANLIHSDQPGGGKYNYKSIDISDINDEIINGTINGQKFDWVSGTEYGTLGDTLLPVYGAEYFEIKGIHSRNLKLLTFDGDDSVSMPVWEEIDDGLWYSGEGDLLNRLLLGETTVDSMNPILEFDTYWDIEDFWDFGFVQVSTDGGATWTSLVHAYMTSDHDSGAKQEIIDNLPGLTGWSGDWFHLEFDLSAYSGQEILIGFRYMTDWATTYEGWYVDNVTVSGVEVVLENFYPEVDFQVSLVFTKNLGKKKTMHFVWDLRTSDDTEIAQAIIWSKWADRVVLVVSPIAEAGAVDYQFKMDKINHRHSGYFW